MKHSLVPTRVLFLISLVIFSTTIVSSVTVAPVPNEMDLGEIQKGESLEKKIYIRSSDVENNFQINPVTYSESDNDLFSRENNYRFEVSEQSFQDWVSLESKTINPDTEQTIELENGAKTRVDGSFNFRIEVPQSAEPGVREGIITLNSELEGGNTTGAGAQLIGETEMKYKFSVPGNAERQIVAENVRGFRRGKDTAMLEVLLRNSGTVTTSVEGFEIDILDSSTGEKIGTAKVSGARLEPRQSDWIRARWKEENKIEQGTYQIDGNVNYMTGSATASGSFSLPGFDVVEVVPSDDGGEGSQGTGGDGLPVWLVVMVLVLLTVLMWGFDIEPFWIIAIVGVLGISAFILMSGLPNFLLAVLLIMVGIVIYGGM